MAKVEWDKTSQRKFETGVRRGVLYRMNASGVYATGEAWNGLTAVTESPSGAEPNAQYADNMKYLNLLSAEEFGCTIEAYTYPDSFTECDGSASVVPGLTVGQQTRKPFGFCYETRLGNDVDGVDFGFKIHLFYNALAAPSEKAFATMNESPEAITLSWEVTTTPVDAGSAYKPTASITIDSSKVVPAKMTQLLDILYGTAAIDPRLPLPAEVFAIFSGSVVEVIPTQPSFVGTTGVITIPVVAGVDYTVDGVVVLGTVVVPTPVGTSRVVKAFPKVGYKFGPNTDDDWMFTRTA